MEPSLNKEPISTKNPAFLALVEKHLNNKEIVVVLVRYANSAGTKDYQLIRTKNEFDALLNQQISKTSITTFFESAFAIKGKADHALIESAKKLFFKEYNEYEGLDAICIEQYVEENSIVFLQDFESVVTWIQNHKESRVLIGTMKFWQKNNEDFLTAYVPDQNGQIITGAY